MFTKNICLVVIFLLLQSFVSEAFENELMKPFAVSNGYRAGLASEKYQWVVALCNSDRYTIIDFHLKLHDWDERRARCVEFSVLENGILLGSNNNGKESIIVLDRGDMAPADGTLVIDATQCNGADNSYAINVSTFATEEALQQAVNALYTKSTLVPSTPLVAMKELATSAVNANHFVNIFQSFDVAVSKDEEAHFYIDSCFLEQARSYDLEVIIVPSNDNHPGQTSKVVLLDIYGCRAKEICFAPEATEYDTNGTAISSFTATNLNRGDLPYSLTVEKRGIGFAYVDVFIRYTPHF